jgi:hypothetical protein
MEFKSHPYYDDSDARDWLCLRSGDSTELEPGPEKALQDLLRADKNWLCELALDRIRSAAGERYLTERPYPDVNEFLFFPIGEQGYRVYVEFFFYQRPDQNSPDSDFWWVIINCPNTVGRRKAYVIGLGWVVL